MSYDCSHKPQCVNQRHHVARFYTMAGRRDEEARQLLRGLLGLTEAQQELLLPTLYTPDGVAQLIAEMDPLVQRKRAGVLSKPFRRAPTLCL